METLKKGDIKMKRLNQYTLKGRHEKETLTRDINMRH